MNTFLVIVSFMAGSSWVPQVSLEPMANMESCRTIRDSAAAITLRASQSNAPGGELVREGEEVVIRIKGIRDMVTFSCEVDVRSANRSLRPRAPNPFGAAIQGDGPPKKDD